MQVYADNAATTFLSKVARDRLIEGLDSFNANPNSLHSMGQRAKEQLDLARASIARCINAEHDNEIFFTSGGSESDNQALVSAYNLGKKQGKTHLITLNFEHHAVLHTMEALARDGATVTYLAPGPDGVLDIKELERAITSETCLVSVMFANNEIGTVQPIAEIGRLCRERGILFHTDAVQVAGHLPIDVQSMNIDMLSMSAHKFHGPKGTGVLYARRGINLTNIIYGGAQEMGKRAGTVNVPSICSMAAALEDACTNLDANKTYTEGLRDRLIEGLLQIPHSKLNGDAKKRLPGNVNISFEGVEGESLLLGLDALGIACSSGSACTSESLAPSHVLLGIGVPVEIAHGSLRFSLCETNTIEEVDYIIKSTKEVVERFRQMSPYYDELLSGEKKFLL